MAEETAVELDRQDSRFRLTTPLRSYELSTPLPGAHQAENAALAVRAAELWRPAIGEEAVARGVASVRWPGRLERFEARGSGRTTVPVFIDGCHNPHGAEALARFLANTGLRADLVFGAMADKDVEAMAAVLGPRVRRIRLVPAGSPRAATPDELARRFSGEPTRRGGGAEPRVGARGAPRGPVDRIYNRGGLSLPGRRGAYAPLRPLREKRMTTAAAPFTREHFERLEEERLAVFASKSARAERPRGPVSSSPGDARTNYARDRDRIIHSRAFRRLKHKTQVFIPYEGDHFRTRLTHTLEVAQIARSVARTLGLNEDLTEAVAIGHDLGHTPFGHSGEYVLDRLLRESHPEAGGFKHNYQSVRVVDRLEKRYDEPGLNLTHDVREGVLKHTAWPRDFPFPLDFTEGLRFESGGSLEAQVVNWSDEIAQQTHDLEDGLPLTEEQEIEELAISRQIRAARGWGSDPASRRASLIRGMIGVLCSDLVEGSRARIERWIEREHVTTSDEFYARRGRLPGGSRRLHGRGQEALRGAPRVRLPPHHPFLPGVEARRPRSPRPGRDLRGVSGQPAPAAGRRAPRPGRRARNAVSARDPARPDRTRGR